MPEVTTSTIDDVRLSTQMVGAVMAGTREIYVRFEKYFYETPGDFSFTLPEWASGYGVVLSGGGGGGRAGSSGLGTDGDGGQGGSLHGIWGRMGSGSGKVMTGTIGAGGAGGDDAGEYGQDGGATTIITHTSNEYSAAGGIAKPTMSSQDGGVTTSSFSDLFSRYINATPGSIYTNGPAGTGNGGSGQRGGGGAGGNGGFFANYSRGGKGGDGFVDIYVWGLPRHQGGTVQITLDSDTQARDQLRAALSARGVNYQTAKYIPFDIELVGTGSAYEMFRNCAMLTTVPEMDTSQVTNMQDMFSECTSLTYVPDLDTGQVTHMRGMFHNCSALTHAPALDTSQVVDSAFMFTHCSSLIHVPDMDTSQNTDMYAMFQNCTSLTDGNVRLNVRLQGANTVNMIENSGLTREPFYDVVYITLGSGSARDKFRNALTARDLDYQTVEEIPFEIELVGTGSTRQMFYGCAALTTVPEMDTSQVTNMNTMFYECSSLTYVPDMDTSQVTDMYGMFRNCSALTDGNVRLIGRNPNVDTASMIQGSGMTREPFYDTAGDPIQRFDPESLDSTPGTPGLEFAPGVDVVPLGDTY